METISYTVKHTDKGATFTNETVHPSRAAARRYANATREAVALYDAKSGLLLSMSGKR